MRESRRGKRWMCNEWIGLPDGGDGNPTARIGISHRHGTADTCRADVDAISSRQYAPFLTQWGIAYRGAGRDAGYRQSHSAGHSQLADWSPRRHNADDGACARPAMLQGFQPITTLYPSALVLLSSCLQLLHTPILVMFSSFLCLHPIKPIVGPLSHSPGPMRGPCTDHLAPGT